VPLTINIDTSTPQQIIAALLALPTDEVSGILIQLQRRFPRINWPVLLTLGGITLEGGGGPNTVARSELMELMRTAINSPFVCRTYAWAVPIAGVAAQSAQASVFNPGPGRLLILWEVVIDCAAASDVVMDSLGADTALAVVPTTSIDLGAPPGGINFGPQFTRRAGTNLTAPLGGNGFIGKRYNVARPLLWRQPELGGNGPVAVLGATAGLAWALLTQNVAANFSFVATEVAVAWS